MPDPFYQNHLVTIYNADSTLFEIDPSSVALVLADPPYGKRERTDRKTKGRGSLAPCNDFPPVIGDDKAFDPTHWTRFKRVILWGGNWFASQLASASKWLVWDKSDALPSKRGWIGFNDNADCELAWTNLKGPCRLLHHRWMGALKASERRERRVHPTQKPVALMEWCIQQANIKPEEGLILDPYMGSGPVLLAAQRLGFKAIGFELEPTYCAVAKSRLEAALQQDAP
jgi:site-specific DNA-methyltransferase (adenine-specific)